MSAADRGQDSFCRDNRTAVVNSPGRFKVPSAACSHQQACYMHLAKKGCQAPQSDLFQAALSLIVLCLQGFRAIPRQDKLALMEALYTKGPLAVSIDAGALLVLDISISCAELLHQLGIKNLLLTSLADHAAADMQGTPASASTRPACEYQARGLHPALLKACSLRQTRTTCSSLAVKLRRHDCNVHRYDEPACKWKQDELDHSVMLVGYGSTEGGKDYWTVK